MCVKVITFSEIFIIFLFLIVVKLFTAIRIWLKVDFVVLLLIKGIEILKGVLLLDILEKDLKNAIGWRDIPDYYKPQILPNLMFITILSIFIGAVVCIYIMASIKKLYVK